MRAFLAALWHPDTRTVVGTGAGVEIRLRIDQTEAFVNGASVELQAAPRIKLDEHTIYFPPDFYEEFAEIYSPGKLPDAGEPAGNEDGGPGAADDEELSGSEEDRGRVEWSEANGGEAVVTWADGTTSAFSERNGLLRIRDGTGYADAVRFSQFEANADGETFPIELRK